jgi:hypothetical protein
MYLANNGRYGVDEKKVNLDDMLTSRPGGLVRTEGAPANSIMPFAHPNMMGEGIKTVEYIDQIKQNRTGVTSYVTSVDANVLNKTAAGTGMLQNAAMAKIELIARVFAETGVKRLVWLIHALSLMNSRKPEVMRLRNEWVTVDPRQWKKRADMTVSVGLGTGNRDQQIQHLGGLLQEQKQALQIGLSTPESIHHTLTKLTNAMGFKDTDSFWPKPQQQQGAQQPPPEAIKAQSDMQLEQLRQQGENQRKQAEIESNERIAMAQIQANDMKAQRDAQEARIHKHMETNAAPHTEVKFDASGQLDAVVAKVDQIAEHMARAHMDQSEAFSQGAAMIHKAAQTIAAPRETVLVRGKDGRPERSISRPAQ